MNEPFGFQVSPSDEDLIQAEPSSPEIDPTSLSQNQTTLLDEPELLTEPTVTKESSLFNTRIIMIILSAICVSVVGMLGTAIFLAFSNVKSQDTPRHSDAMLSEWSASDRYREYIYRHDRSPKVYSSSPGAMQQLIANEATRKAEAIAQQRTDPNHPGFRKHSSVLWELAAVNGNEKLLLASVGQSATLKYVNSEGKLVEEKISPSKLAALGLIDIAAVEEGQILDIRPDFSLDEIITTIGQMQRDVRLTRAARLAEQNLTDPAKELMELQTFRQLSRKK